MVYRTGFKVILFSHAIPKIAKSSHNLSPYGPVLSCPRCTDKIRPLKSFSPSLLLFYTLTSQPVHFSLPFQLREVCITKE